MKLKSIKPSHISDKKYDAVFETDGKEKVVPFGAKGMDDFTRTHDPEQRRRYIERHGRGAENWRDPTSPGALSRYILWGESTSLTRNIAAFRKRFSL